MKHTTDTSLTADTPAAQDIREELQRVLNSSRFESAHRASQFLRYAVEETLAGRPERLKGFTIAVDVFGRSREFDASIDPLVRVEARRLRRRLDDYYATEGRDNPLRIELPVGRYVPRFSSVGDDLKSRGAGNGLRWPSVAALAALVAAAIWVVTVQETGSSESAALHGIDSRTESAPVPRVAVVGFTNLTGDPRLDSFVSGLTEETLIRLSEFGLQVVVGGDLPNVELEVQPQTLVEANARYLLRGSVRRQDELVRITLRLVELGSGAQVWTRSFDEPLRLEESVSIQERIGTRIAAILTNPFGPMYEREIGKFTDVPLAKLDRYGCIVQFRAYAKSLDSATHERSRRCFLRVIDKSQTQSAQIWAGLALVYQHEFWYGYNPQPELGDALQRAFEAAWRAVDLDDQNLLAQLAMAGVCYTRGDLTGFSAAAEHALKLKHNPSAAAQVGFLMTLAGQVQYGRALFEEAFTAEPSIPSWYYVGYSFNAMARGEHEQALDLALRANAPHWFAAPLAAAAAAGLAGRSDLAAHWIERLLIADPEFARTERQRLEGWIQDPTLIDLIITGLYAGGLGLCPDCGPEV